MADHVAVLRDLHRELTAYCRDLDDAAWQTPSRAEGWRVHDVVAHVGGTAKALFMPSVLKILTSKDIEATNDDFVDDRRSWDHARVLAEYDTWGRRVAGTAAVVSRTPVARAPLPVGELGRFPFTLILTGALVFDQHTHLHHDIAPALDRPAPTPDAARMERVLAWMWAVLAHQLTSAAPGWLDRSVAVTLDGPGGGTWRIEPTGAVQPGGAAGTGAQITGRAVDFPVWGTARLPWRDQDVSVTGDDGLATAFLDGLNVV